MDKDDTSFGTCLEALGDALNDVLGEQLGDDIGFILLVVTPGEPNKVGFVGNALHEEVLQAVAAVVHEPDEWTNEATSIQ